MGKEVVLLDKQNGVATITLNRAEQMNGLNVPMVSELVTALNGVAEDDAVKAVIITGKGKAFCAGGDVANHPTLSSPDPMDRYDRILEAHEVPLTIHHMPKPVIAAINGFATGAGLDLALACDLRIAAEGAVLAELFVRVGVMSDWGGSYFLPRIVGLGKALELLLLGDDIDSQEAYRIGLVNWVVPKDKLLGEANALAKRFAEGPGLAYRFIKKAVYDSLSPPLEQALETERYGQALLIGTEDAQGAIKAFMERRKPVFKGK